MIDEDRLEIFSLIDFQIFIPPLDMYPDLVVYKTTPNLIIYCCCFRPFNLFSIEFRIFSIDRLAIKIMMCSFPERKMTNIDIRSITRIGHDLHKYWTEKKILLSNYDIYLVKKHLLITFIHRIDCWFYIFFLFFMSH